MTPKRMSVQQVAEYLQVNEKTVRNLIRRGELRAIRVGTQFRVSPDDLERYEESVTYQPFSPNPHHAA